MEEEEGGLHRRNLLADTAVAFLELFCIKCMSWKPKHRNGLTADQPNPLSSRESEWY